MCTSPLDTLSDEELMQRFAQGEPAALGVIVGRWKKRLFAFAYRIVDCREDAEDVVQSVWHKVLEKAETYDPRRPFKPWVMRICYNQAVNTLRRRRVAYPSPVRDRQPSGRTDDLGAAAAAAGRGAGGAARTSRFVESAHRPGWAGTRQGLATRLAGRLHEDRDQSSRRQVRAAQALGALGDARAVQALLTALRQDGDELVRQGAAEALGAFLDHPDWFPPLNQPSDSTALTPPDS